MLQRNHYKILTLVILVLISFSFCFIVLDRTSNNYQLDNQRYHFLHFGTTIQITLPAREKMLDDVVVNQIENLLSDLHSKWHPWRNGDLKQLNTNLAALRPFEVSEELATTIQKGQLFYDASLGYFNPAIGKLVAYWGFHQDLPSPTQAKNLDISLEEYRKNPPNPNHIIIKKGPHSYTIQNTNPFLQLDLSGYIKADAAIQIKKILLDNDIHNALINIGGDIHIMGNKSPNNYWIIAVKGADNKMIKLSVQDDENIASSGVYARQYEKEGKQYHHIINPKTLESAKGFYGVTVIDHDPYLTDAAATALLIAGESNYLPVAQSMHIDKYILITTDQRIIYSDAIKTRIQN